MKYIKTFESFVNEVYRTPVSGTKAGWTTGLSHSKYELKKEVKGAKLGSYVNVVLPKGTIVSNLPGGVFAKHEELKKKYCTGYKSERWDDRLGVMIISMPDTLEDIEQSSKILEKENNQEDIKAYESFISEGLQETYKDLERDLVKTFEKTGIAKRCYNGEIVVSGSSWTRPHPNGSIGVTFWLMESVPTAKLDKAAKEWAKKHGLTAATFYPDGLSTNSNPAQTQNWSNKAAMNANYIYGFTFYDEDSYALKSVYKPLK